jgi:hypothetical protein
MYYREFVAQKIDSNERLWDRVINGIYLGSHSWEGSWGHPLGVVVNSGKHFGVVGRLRP